MAHGAAILRIVGMHHDATDDTIKIDWEVHATDEVANYTVPGSTVLSAELTEASYTQALRASVTEALDAAPDVTIDRRRVFVPSFSLGL